MISNAVGRDARFKIHHGVGRSTRSVPECRLTDAINQSGYTVTHYIEPDDVHTETVWFTPIATLYKAYVRWFAENAANCETPLNPIQFGVGFARNFGFGVERGDPRMWRKQFRHVKGKRVWGYIGVKGPGSIEVRFGKRGRRKVERPRTYKATSRAAEVSRRGEEADAGDGDSLLARSLEVVRLSDDGSDDRL